MSPAGYTAPTIPPQITFYTFPACPWCQRIRILLDELALPFKEVRIDLEQPRPQWYLDINPRGLVPALTYTIPTSTTQEPSSSPADPTTTTTTYESHLIADLLTSARPSHLLPPPLSTPTTPLTRSKILLFADALTNALGGSLLREGLLLPQNNETAQSEWVEKVVHKVKSEVLPLLEASDAGSVPSADFGDEDAHDGVFFARRTRPTLAEVLAVPFVARVYTFTSPRNGEGEGKGKGFLPAALREGLDALPRFKAWAEAARALPSVRNSYDEAEVLRRTGLKVQKLRAEKGA